MHCIAPSCALPSSLSSPFSSPSSSPSSSTGRSSSPFGSLFLFPFQRKGGRKGPASPLPFNDNGSKQPGRYGIRKGYPWDLDQRPSPPPGTDPTHVPRRGSDMESYGILDGNGEIFRIRARIRSSPGWRDRRRDDDDGRDGRRGDGRKRGPTKHAKGC